MGTEWGCCISKDYSQHQHGRKEDTAVSWCVMIQSRQDAAITVSVSLIPAKPEEVWEKQLLLDVNWCKRC